MAKEYDMDICLKCGEQVEPESWRRCHGERTVHRDPCSLCGRIVGYLIDDDYCHIEKLICPDCLDKITGRENKKYTAD